MSDPSPVSPVAAGLGCKCPRCGTGRLFRGYLTLVPRCEDCDLDLAFADSADGPAVFVILIVGIIVVGLVLVTEVKYQPPVWLHLVLWLPLTIALSLALLRPLKGLAVALQYANRAAEGRRED